MSNRGTGSGEVGCPVCGVALDVELELEVWQLVIDPSALFPRVSVTLESRAEISEHIREHGRGES